MQRRLAELLRRRFRYDHVAVGTGTVVNKTSIKQYQQATRDRSSVKTEGGKIIRVEAHPIPEHPRPRRCKGRVALIGDAAGYVTKCSGAVLPIPKQKTKPGLPLLTLT